MLFIGVDLGTSAVKMILMEESGKILRTVSKRYPLFLPETGWSEQNPEDWFEKTMEGMIELTDDVDRSQVAGIGVGGQMHGLVCLDEKDEVIRPAILWNDSRSEEETLYLNREIGKDRLAGYTANIAYAGFTAPKILWMKKNEPENFRRIRKIMLPKDFLVYRLTGEQASDMSDASGMLLLDVKNRRWSEEMLDICSVKEEWLPKLYESSDVVGALRPALAEKLGFSGKVKIVAGAGDNAAAAIGTGTVRNGDCNLSLGTSGTVFVSCDQFSMDREHALHAFAHANKKYHLMGCMLSAASCNQWWYEKILGTDDYSGEQKDIRKLGENKVIYLPYLMGERSPHNDPGARSAFIGMSMDTSREEMNQAVLEGVAYGLRDSLEIVRSLGIPVERSKICGGGARSGVWKKILTNVLNVTLEVPEADEGPSLGGAMLAAVGCGVFRDVDEAADRIVRIRESVEPEPELVEKYEKQYRKFVKFYPALKNIF
jgi:xylulokinase